VVVHSGLLASKLGSMSAGYGILTAILTVTGWNID